jgi:pimeloyl-ACP methyl ester carboxylesterase
MKPPHDELVHANGVDLCVEVFGDPVDPAILLIGGATASMDWWEDEFCERLAAGLPISSPRRHAHPRRVKIGDDRRVVRRTLPCLWCP